MSSEGIKKTKILISFVSAFLVFTIFSTSISAINYGEGMYNKSLYSEDVPSSGDGTGAGNSSSTSSGNSSSSITSPVETSATSPQQIDNFSQSTAQEYKNNSIEQESAAKAEKGKSWLYLIFGILSLTIAFFLILWVRRRRDDDNSTNFQNPAYRPDR